MKANQNIASPSDGSANPTVSPIQTRAKRSLMPLILGASLVAASGCALAQPGGDRPGRGGPPPEALTACESLSEGAACSFSGRKGEVSGQCIATPDESLACAPEDHMSRQQGGNRSDQ